ncbi:IS256 family transposase [Labilibaculum filiforme]|uniref:IS256 family transposase n=1 Tax=Labilibaculum filiforme TaxID=1940526 RepID=UPI000C6DD779|nr:IS256 family transposase [Labilibaculum filiforme]
MDKSDLKAHLESQKKSGKNIHDYMNDLYQEGLQTLLETELDEHLGYPKNETSSSGNARNGSSKKNVKLKSSAYTLSIPRDRAGSFDPQIVPKHKRVIDQIEDYVITLYSKRMSVRDVQDTIQDLYCIDIDKSTISRFTDRLLPRIEKWRNRALDEFYFVLWMDGIHIKVKENHRLVSKCVYIIMGLNTQGINEVLGLWIGKEECASFWREVLNDIKARGVKDILLTATDNLKGFTKAIQAAFTKAITQICVVHMVRQSFGYIISKKRKAFSDNLKMVYKAPNREMAEEYLVSFEAKWLDRYPSAVKPWSVNWNLWTCFFDYTHEIRKIIYTTNAIENLNKNIRKYTRNKM